MLGVLVLDRVGLSWGESGLVRLSWVGLCWAGLFWV